MKFLKNILLAILIVFLQLGVVFQLPFFLPKNHFISFNFLVVALFFLVFWREDYIGYLVALVAGLLLDLFGDLPLGTFTFVYIVLVFLLFEAKNRFFRHPRTKFLLILALLYVVFARIGQGLMLIFLDLEQLPLEWWLGEPLLNFLLIGLVIYFKARRFSFPRYLR